MDPSTVMFCVIASVRTVDETAAGGGTHRRGRRARPTAPTSLFGGSLATPGAETVRCGGNTSWLETALSDGQTGAFAVGF